MKAKDTLPNVWQMETGTPHRKLSLAARSEGFAFPSPSVTAVPIMPAAATAANFYARFVSMVFRDCCCCCCCRAGGGGGGGGERTTDMIMQ